uniref:Sulfotransferase domain-containing protein n=1 Tax=viral metagenome TaxID=1070528 RepID=A0A6C0IA49_9ZZZZ
MNNIDILIYSLPKTGGNTLRNTLEHFNFKTYYTHDKYFFQAKFPGQNNSISLKKYIENNSENKKLTIITVYRDSFFRNISLFFQSFEYKYKLDINNITVESLIDIYNSNLQNNYNEKNGLFETFPNELTEFKFDHTKKYSLWESGNIRFVVLRYNDINSWPDILSNIFDIECKQLKNSNYSPSKKYYNVYKKFLNTYKINNIEFEKLINSIELDIFFTEDEKNKYIESIKEKN